MDEVRQNPEPEILLLHNQADEEYTLDKESGGGEQDGVVEDGVGENGSGVNWQDKFETVKEELAVERVEKAKFEDKCGELEKRLETLNGSK